MDVKNKACDALLAHRVENKLKGNKINTIINRIHVAQPKARDEVVREPFIPDVVKERKKFDKSDPERRKLEKDIELEEGGPGVYNINMKSEYRALRRGAYVFLPFEQRTTSLPTPSGMRISSLRLWTARMSPTLSIPTSSKSSRLWSGRRRSWRQRASTIAKRRW